jgi:hypothetical protein
MFAKTFKSEGQVMLLFNEMAKTDDYDEKILKQKTGLKNLVAAKISLRKILFKAMRNYREGIDIQQELRDSLSNINFLLRKELKEEAGKEIRKAIRLAEKGEAYLYLSELLVCSATPFNKELKPDEITGYFMGVKVKQQKAVSLLQEVQQAQLYENYLTYFLINANYESPLEMTDKMAAIGAEIENVLPDVQSGFARIRMLITLAKAHGGREKCYETFHQIYTLYKKDPFNAHKHPELYLKFLLNYTAVVASEPTYAKLSTELFSAVEQGLSDFENYFKYYPDTLNHCKIRLTGNKLNFARVNNNWNGFDILLEQVRAYTSMRGLRKEVVSALTVLALINALFSQKRYAEALDWVQVYYGLPSGKVLKPTMFCVRFFEVICFYGIKDYYLSAIKAKNLVKTLEAGEFTGDYFKLFAAFLRRLNYWGDDAAKQKAEIADIKAGFKKLREADDDHYFMLVDFLEPEKTINHLFA